MLRFVLYIFSIQFSLSVAAKQNFIILQYNDINGQLERFKEGTDPPIPEPQVSNSSVGGLASLIGEIKSQTQNALPTNTPVLKISPGNLVGGTSGWISIFGWNTYGGAVRDYYKPNIMGLGLSDFGANLSMTNDYIQNAFHPPPRPESNQNEPIVTNLNCDITLNATEYAFCNRTKRFHIQKLKDYSIGFLGFVNPLAMNLSEPDSLVFDDVPESLLAQINGNQELKALKTIIAVGSGNLKMAEAILSKIDKVKLVIYAGGKPGNGEYPITYEKTRFIAASSKFMYGQNLGKMTFTLDEDNGDLELVSSEVIKITKDKFDSGAASFVTNLKQKRVYQEQTETIGTTLVNLDGKREKCWRTECNLGNLVTDAMVHCSLNRSLGFSLEQVGALSVWTSGSLVDFTILRGDNISSLDIHRWLPYQNDVYLVSVNGSTLREIFKISGTAIVANKDKKFKDWGQFLQVSNAFEVHYSDTGDLQSLNTLHLNDSVPSLRPISDELIYTILMPSFIYNGRSVYSSLQGKFLKISESSTGPEYFKLIGSDDDCLVNYVKSIGPLINGFERRIYIGPTDSSPKCQTSNTGTTVALTIIIFLLIVGTIYAGWKFLVPYLRSGQQIPFHSFSQ